MSSLVKSTKHLRKKKKLTIYKSLENVKERLLPKLFYEASIFLLIKPDEAFTRKEQQYIKRMIHYD